MKRFMAWILTLLLLPALTACAAPGTSVLPVKPTPAGTSVTQRATQPSTGPSTGITDAVVDGGILRLWWPERTSLNPLMEMTIAGQAVYDLVYQGLFRIEADDRISPAVASNIVTLEGGLQVLIAINETACFHNGDPVTSSDVAQLLEHLVSPECQSPWRMGLEAIESVRILDERVIELRLNQPDPWLAWALTFPIVPAIFIDIDGFTLVPGTGPYAISSYDPDTGTVLTAVDPTEKPMTTIIVREFLNQQAAMRAFENDGLDLVLLDTQLLSGYTVRSSLRIDHFTGPEVLFVSCNSRNRRTLADEAKLARLKQVLQDMKKTSKAFSDWAETSSLGFSAVSWLGLQDGTSVADILAQQPSDWSDQESTLLLIVPEQDARRVRLANEMAAWLSRAGISCSVNSLARDRFWQDLAAGRYDLALLSAQLPVKPQPGFLVREPANPLFADLAAIRDDGAGLSDEALWREIWQQALPFPQSARGLSDPIDAGWLKALTETTARSPWEILCLPYLGLVYGNRVSGQCRPNRYHPYDNIEELWIWSGQSSSSS
jgi:ABC-type transport system substrate-binding protein